MLKKHMAACLFATTFVAAPALAQNTTAPSGGTDRPAASASGSATTGSPAMQPAPAPAAPAAPGASTMSSGSSTTTAPSAPSSTASGSSTTGTSGTTSGSSMTAAPSGSAGQSTFVTQLQGEQLMASKLIGTTVISANNESIGDVNDVIMDRDGKAMAVVIGVGGFLGIGEKDVAVSFDKLDFNPPQQTAAANTNPPPAAGSAGSNPAATTGSTSSPAGAANRPATTANTARNNEGGVPDRVMLRMTKAELQAAPTFRASGNAATNNNAATGNTTAPK